MIARRFLVLASTVATCACVDTPIDPSQFASAGSDATTEAGTLQDGNLQDGNLQDGNTVADTAGQDASQGTDTTPETTAPGPVCHAALSCLVAKKLWTKGGPAPRNLACTKGMSANETAEMDAVTGCAAKACGDELDAWDKGGAAEQKALYKCLIGKCTTQMTHCLGGHGPDTCAKAIYCLNKCGAVEEACSTDCVAPTTEPHAGKTGAFLECMLAKCPIDKLSTCTVPLSCGVHCPELGG